jgi:hypothetical protein
MEFVQHSMGQRGIPLISCFYMPLIRFNVLHARRQVELNCNKAFAMVLWGQNLGPEGTFFLSIESPDDF